MSKEIKKLAKQAKGRKGIPIVSRVFNSGEIMETVYDPEKRRTSFVIWNGQRFKFESSYSDGKYRFRPYSPGNNLIRNQVVLLPEKPEGYESEEQLVSEIRDFIHRYVDISPLFEKIATYYVLFSWIYDGFKELPYLRLRGDPGSGKTRFLLTVGSVCYKPIFASGASTISPIFRMLEEFRGTLIIDEGDFRVSDEKAEIVKILNNGNAQGFPVLRSEVSGKEFNPKAYHVFGPKIVATRGFFKDRALESRFLTEEMGQRKLREDIPINLPASHKDEARRLRNKLLMFRFRNLNKRPVAENLVDRTIEPRLNQVFVPLLSIIEDTGSRDEIRQVARQYNQEMIAERGLDTEAQVLEIVRELLGNERMLTVVTITSLFIEKHEHDYERKITGKWIGYIIRKKLGLKTQKSKGNYEIAPGQKPKLELLFEKYGLNPLEQERSREN